MLGNLFRDQLDRYGELETLADEWAAMVDQRAGRSGFVLNADDPLIADLGRDRELRRRPGVTYFGIEDPAQALPELQHAHDAKHCRRCGHPYAYERAFVGHLGHYSCPNCGADRPEPDLAATEIELRGMTRLAGAPADARRARPSSSCPSPASTTSTTRSRRWRPRCGSASAWSGRSGRWRRSQAAFGRVETIEVGRHAGLDPADQEPRRRQRGPAHAAARGRGRRAQPRALDLWIALNDRIADGRDVSWIWDADFELLAGVARSVVCAGTRAPEMAVRLKYAGVDPAAIDGRALDRALARPRGGGGATGALFALPTYTALIELRRLLAARGLAREFWR